MQLTEINNQITMKFFDCVYVMILYGRHTMKIFTTVITWEKRPEMKNTNAHIPTEAEEQTLLMRWAEVKSIIQPEVGLLFHIPNGGSRNAIEAKHLKQQGVKRGVPDLFLPVARSIYHGLFVEMKRVNGGKVSEEQKAWIARLMHQGYMVAVCKGCDEAIETIENYLAMR